MHQIKLKATKRERKKKQACSKLRNEGHTPGIIYGKDFDNVMVHLDALDLRKALTTSAGSRVIINLEVEDGKKVDTYTTMVMEIQRDIYQKRYLHVDFHRISLDEIVHMEVPIILTGTAQGVKMGGMLDQLTRTATMEGLPLDLPEKVEVDVSHMEEHDLIYIKDISVGDNVTVLNDPEDAVAVVHPPRVLALEEEEAEEGEEGETPVEGEAVEDEEAVPA